MIQVIFHPNAKNELENSIIFYNNQVKRLGSVFLEEVEYFIGLIQNFPKSGKLLTNNVRKLLLKRFPYMILYIFKNNQVYIVDVAHQMQKPNYWKKRLK